jgi:hypothetical protein
MGVISDLIPDINGILGVRDDLGAALKQVYLVTRTWTGAQIGAGSYTETRVQMLPSPRVVEFKNDLRIREGGAVKQGDVMLKMVSKETYAQADLDFSNVSGAVEKFYELGGELYRPIGVTEKHVCWSVLLRRQSNQSRVSP